MSTTTHRIPWPRVAYGYTEIILTDDEAFDPDVAALAALTMETAFMAARALHEAPARQEAPYEPGEPEYERDPEPERNDAPPRRPAFAQAQRGAPARTQASQAPASGLSCPEHRGVALVESLAKYQEYDDIDGVMMPAKFFCPGKENGTGTNHTVYRSKAIPVGAR